MKAFKGYEEAKNIGASKFEQLPKGGYICEIKKASVETGNYGEQLVVALDVAVGPYSGFFARNYREQDREDKKWTGYYYLTIPADDGSERDEWDKRKFKTFINAVEDSNAKYHWNWDETTLAGKLFGALFIEKEKLSSDGSTVYRNTICNGATTVSAIKEGKYRLPKDKLLKDKPVKASAPKTTSEGFMDVPAGAEEEGLPF